MKTVLVLFAGALAAAVPEKLTPNADEKKVVQVHGVGDQIYSCQNTNGTFNWTLKAPDAQLFSAENQVVGRHFAGPTWEWNDKSSVVGRVAANVPSPESSSIPWLLLTVLRHEGTGYLDAITSIQRINTKGGKAPAEGCETSHVGEEKRIHYEADYVFYAKDK